MWLLSFAFLGLLPGAEVAKADAYPNPKLLMEARDLAKGDKAPILLDVRSEFEYVAGHVPGAYRVDVARWNKAFTAGPDRKTWAELLAPFGITPDKTVVVYGEDLRDTARVWWILRYWGVRDARILNGGWQAWQAA